jgi:hypothetical protein
MNLRVAATLVVLLLVLGGGAILYHQQQGSRQASNVATLGQPLLKGLTVADVASIRISAPKARLTLQRHAEGWTITERAGFPADFGKVRAFLLKAIELKIGQSEQIGDRDRGRLELVAPGTGDGAGTLLEFLAADGKPLARLLIGKKYFKQEPGNSDRAPGDGRFVLLPDAPGTVYIVSDPLTQATAASAAWIDTTGIKAEKLKAMEVRAAGGIDWKIERSGDNAEWKLEGARPGEKLDVTKANAASYSLSLLELADVAPEATTAQQAGFDKPSATINATTLAGLDYRFTLGKLQGANYYVKFTVDGAQAKPREKELARHTLLIDKSKFEDVLKKRSELLEKKK